MALSAYQGGTVALCLEMSYMRTFTRTQNATALVMFEASSVCDVDRWSVCICPVANNVRPSVDITDG